MALSSANDFPWSDLMRSRNKNTKKKDLWSASRSIEIQAAKDSRRDHRLVDTASSLTENNKVRRQTASEPQTPKRTVLTDQRNSFVEVKMNGNTKPGPSKVQVRQTNKKNGVAPQPRPRSLSLPQQSQPTADNLTFKWSPLVKNMPQQTKSSAPPKRAVSSGASHNNQAPLPPVRHSSRSSTSSFSRHLQRFACGASYLGQPDNVFYTRSQGTVGEVDAWKEFYSESVQTAHRQESVPRKSPLAQSGDTSKQPPRPVPRKSVSDGQKISSDVVRPSSATQSSQIGRESPRMSGSMRRRVVSMSGPPTQVPMPPPRSDRKLERGGWDSLRGSTHSLRTRPTSSSTEDSPSRRHSFVAFCGNKQQLSSSTEMIPLSQQHNDLSRSLQQGLYTQPTKTQDLYAQPITSHRRDKAREKVDFQGRPLPNRPVNFSPVGLLSKAPSDSATSTPGIRSSVASPAQDPLTSSGHAAFQLVESDHSAFNRTASLQQRLSRTSSLPVRPSPVMATNPLSEQFHQALSKLQEKVEKLEEKQQMVATSVTSDRSDLLLKMRTQEILLKEILSQYENEQRLHISARRTLKRRVQVLETHVVSLARAVAHLSTASESSSDSGVFHHLTGKRSASWRSLAHKDVDPRAITHIDFYAGQDCEEKESTEEEISKSEGQLKTMDIKEIIKNLERFSF